MQTGEANVNRQIELAYAAGFIDADGSIMITKSKAKRYTRGFKMSSRISACGVDLAPLERLHATFGGSIHKKPETKGSKITARLQTYYWTVTNLKSVEAAKELIPYLTIKRRQAELLIDFYEGGSWKKGGSRPGFQGGGRSIPDGEWERREALREVVQGLNARNYLERLAA